MKFFVFVLLVAPVFAAEDWGPVQFLIGNWTGDGSGQPGQGSGSFSFAPDLQGKVLLRRNFAEYPAQNGKPASRHDDLMIVFREEGELKATYFDSEGHVIRYSVHAAEGGVVFAADPGQNTPGYRLTYTSAGKDSLTLKFEIAPPGKEFVKYIEATAHRSK